MCIYDLPNSNRTLDIGLKYLDKVFVEKNNYAKCVISQVFTQLKLINESNLSTATIKIIEA